MLIYNLKNWPTTTILNSVFRIRKKFYNSKKNRFIILAAYPRSACNYISYLISETEGYARRKLSWGSGFFHETIYLPKLIDNLTKKTIVTQHIRANSEIRSIIQEFDLKITILVRNIFDVIISYNDFIKKHENGWSPLDPDRGGNFPEFCKEYFNFEDSKKYDYIIEMVVPWYISFYASWYNYTIAEKTIKGIWLSYEKFFEDQKSSLLKIFEFYNVEANETVIEELIKRNLKVNYNKGYSGRGKLLTNSQKNRVKYYTSFFPSVDFSLIGL
jgi:Sulfotransferase domain